MVDAWLGDGDLARHALPVPELREGADFRWVFAGASGLRGVRGAAGGDAGR